MVPTSQLTIANHVGKLVEFHFPSYDVSDVELTRGRSAWRAAIEKAAKSSDRIVVCCDFRSATVLSPRLVEACKGFMAGDNVKMAKSCIVAGDGWLFTNQLDRLIREGNNPNRQRVGTMEAAVNFLADVLAPTELARLRRFLTENTPDAASSPTERQK